MERSLCFEMEDGAVEEKHQLNKEKATGNSRVYPNKLIACKPGSTEVGNTIKSLECQAEEHVRYKESFRVILCGGCLEDTKASGITQEGCSQTKAYEQVWLGRGS